MPKETSANVINLSTFALCYLICFWFCYNIFCPLWAQEAAYSAEKRTCSVKLGFMERRGFHCSTSFTHFVPHVTHLGSEGCFLPSFLTIIVV